MFERRSSLLSHLTIEPANTAKTLRSAGRFARPDNARPDNARPDNAAWQATRPALRLAAALLLAAQVIPSAAWARTDGATVILTTQPGSALEATARKLVSTDIKESKAAGAPPVLLVGSAPLAAGHGEPALFVQVQSADFCGSAGCSTSAYLRRGGAWKKVLDSISGPIKVSVRSHKGMHDLILHSGDRWVWDGSAYIDTLPTPAIDLRHSTKG